MHVFVHVFALLAYTYIHFGCLHMYNIIILNPLVISRSYECVCMRTCLCVCLLFSSNQNFDNRLRMGVVTIKYTYLF